MSTEEIRKIINLLESVNSQTMTPDQLLKAARQKFEEIKSMSQNKPVWIYNYYSNQKNTKQLSMITQAAAIGNFSTYFIWIDDGLDGVIADTLCSNILIMTTVPSSLIIYKGERRQTHITHSDSWSNSSDNRREQLKSDPRIANSVQKIIDIVKIACPDYLPNGMSPDNMPSNVRPLRR